METLPKTKDELLKEIDAAASELETTLADLSSERMVEARDQGGWSIQDHLDHLVVWEDSAALLLERRPLAERFAAMRVDAGTAKAATEDELNAIVRERQPQRTLEETRAALRASHEHLRRALAPLSDADLARPHSFYQPEEWGGGHDKPVMNWIVGNSSGHYREHLPWIQALAALGDAAPAMT